MSNPELPADLVTPEVRAHLTRRTLEFIDAVYDEALIALEEGDAATRASMWKMTLPILLKAQEQAKDEGKDAEEVHENTRKLFEMMQQELAPDDDEG